MKLIVKVNGGLGNQLFQYALGRKLALANNADLFLDLSFFNASGAHTARPFELDALHTRYALATGADLEAIARLRASRVQRLLSKAAPGLAGMRIITERSTAFDPSVLQVTGDVYLEGHWQSEKYFVDIREVLIGELTLRDEPGKDERELMERMDAVASVSLHIRRGDYVTNPAAASFHGLCGLDYYERAIDTIKQRVISPELFVFSDDLAWAKENLRSDLRTSFVELGPSVPDRSELRLMSCCRHHIIANSSFSWWGAWLNPRDDKVVVAPKVWYAESSMDTRDLIPTGWILQ